MPSVCNCLCAVVILCILQNTEGNIAEAPVILDYIRENVLNLTEGAKHRLQEIDNRFNDESNNSYGFIFLFKECVRNRSLEGKEIAADLIDYINYAESVRRNKTIVIDECNAEKSGVAFCRITESVNFIFLVFKFIGKMGYKIYRAFKFVQESVLSLVVCIPATVYNLFSRK